MPPAPSTPASQVDIEALADSLSACADTLHTRLMRASRSQPRAGAVANGTIDHVWSQGAAQALFETEVSLRQRANGLYLDAAGLAGSGLDGRQHQLLDLTAQAQDKIRKINRLRDMIDLMADLLSLAAALAAGKPEHLGPAVEKMRRHLADLAAGEPPSTQA